MGERCAGTQRKLWNSSDKAGCDIAPADRRQQTAMAGKTGQQSERSTGNEL
jgi:hypothetical protein